MKTLISFLFSFLWILPPLAGAQNLSNELWKFRKDPALAGAGIGYRIEELKSGKTIAFQNSDKLFIPASTLKTLYAFSVLQDYGPDKKFKTDLLFKGYISQDTLYGNLYLRAEGDPSFGNSKKGDLNKMLDQICTAIQANRIHYINGNFILQVNGWHYPAAGSWPIEDLGNYYGSGYWGFNYNGNTYKIYFKPASREGQAVEVDHIEPPIDGLKLYSHVHAGPRDSGDNAYIYGDPLTYERHIFGTVPVSDKPFVIKGAIPNPPASFMNTLKNYCLERGVIVLGRYRVSNQIKKFPGEQILWKYESPTLMDLVKHTLNYSDNLYSEAFARLVIEKGRPADGYLSKDSINAYFRKKGFQLIDLEDGSGLAPDNLIAPKEFTAFFRRIAKQKGVDYLKDILPHAGEDGYAKHFMDGSAYQDQVWVKSGSVSKVHNYVGIFKGKSGKYYTFAIMVNHFKTSHKKVTKAIEDFLAAVIKKL